MLPATDDKVERWRIKYGGDFPDYLKKVKEGKLTIQELADWMKVTKETARRYFHKYYSEADLVGTRFFKQGDAIRLPQQSVGMDDSKIESMMKNPMMDNLSMLGGKDIKVQEATKTEKKVLDLTKKSQWIQG